MEMISAVYIIRNKINGKFYIGSSINCRRRLLNEHRNDLRKGKHDNLYLQRAWNKYGEENFEFSIYEQYSDTPELELRAREQYLLDVLKPEYNLSDSAYFPTRTKEQIEYTCQKIRKKYIVTSPDGSEIIVDNLPKFCRDNCLRPQSMYSVCAGRTGQHKGWKCRHWQDMLQKFTKKRDYNYVFLSPDGIEIESQNLQKFCLDRNLHQSSMWQVLKGKTYSCSGWRVRFKDSDFAKHSGRNKKWIVTDKDGRETKTSNLKGFCRSNKLDMKCMRNVSKGKSPHHRGWKCRLEGDDVPIFSSRKGNVYKIVSPDGKEQVIRSLFKFCKKNNLTHQCMSAVAHGKQSHHRGWKCSVLENDVKIT